MENSFSSFSRDPASYSIKAAANDSADDRNHLGQIDNTAFSGFGKLKIETCRASGNGGQHVNTTDSAVRVIHLPTGTEANASEERSQTRNKALAILRLQEKLHLITEQRQAAEK